MIRPATVRLVGVADSPFDAVFNFYKDTNQTDPYNITEDVTFEYDDGEPITPASVGSGTLVVDKNTITLRLLSDLTTSGLRAFKLKLTVDEQDYYPLRGTIKFEEV